jgi:hypothetical protein
MQDLPCRPFEKGAVNSVQRSGFSNTARIGCSENKRVKLEFHRVRNAMPIARREMVKHKFFNCAIRY